MEQDIIFRTEVPDDYVTITSGLLGDQKPKAILIVPVITNEKVYGAVEFAGFEKFSPLHIRLIQELGDIVARTIFNVKVNENTARLFEEIKRKPFWPRQGQSHQHGCAGWQVPRWCSQDQQI